MKEEKKYLNFMGKCAYGVGSMGSEFFYSFLSSFILIYLTNAVGLNAGIVGTLMMVSRFLDGFTDVIFGNILDRTKSKLGKARFWILVTTLPIAVCEILLFSIPQAGEVVQYIYFFVIYTVVNCVFFTANSIAYSTLSMLITANKGERVQLGMARFIFTMISGVVIGAATIGLVDNFGGGTAGWRAVAIIYAILYTVLLFVCGLATRELSPAELGSESRDKKDEQVGLVKSLGYVFRNKFFMLQLAINIFFNLTIVSSQSVGVYYMTYVFRDPGRLGLFAMLQGVAMVVGLSFAPALVKRMGIYKANLYGMFLAIAAGAFYAYFGMGAMMLPMMISLAIACIGRGPLIANNQALTAEISEYSLKRDGVRLEGSMYSCTSMGMKIGGGLGTALTGWALALTAYDGAIDVQPESALTMIKCLYVVLPLIVAVIMTFLQSRLKVEQANEAISK